jgi:hypothetical protein
MSLARCGPPATQPHAKSATARTNPQRSKIINFLRLYPDAIGYHG